MWLPFCLRVVAIWAVVILGTHKGYPYDLHDIMNGFIVVFCWGLGYLVPIFVGYFLYILRVLNMTFHFV